MSVVLLVGYNSLRYIWRVHHTNTKGRGPIWLSFSALKRRYKGYHHVVSRGCGSFKIFVLFPLILITRIYKHKGKKRTQRLNCKHYNTSMTQYVSIQLTECCQFLAFHISIRVAHVGAFLSLIFEVSIKQTPSPVGFFL